MRWAPSFVGTNPHIHSDSDSFGCLLLVLLAQLSIDANLSLLYKDVERMCMRIGIGFVQAWRMGKNVVAKDGKYDRPYSIVSRQPFSCSDSLFSEGGKTLL